MRFVKGNENTEAGVMPSDELLRTMGRFNEELQKAGVQVDLSGPQHISKCGGFLRLMTSRRARRSNEPANSRTSSRKSRDAAARMSILGFVVRRTGRKFILVKGDQTCDS